MDHDEVIEAAKNLLSEHGENPEYDRAIFELTHELVGGNEKRVTATRLGLNLAYIYPETKGD